MLVHVRGGFLWSGEHKARVVLSFFIGDFEFVKAQQAAESPIATLPGRCVLGPFRRIREAANAREAKIFFNFLEGRSSAGRDQIVSALDRLADWTDHGEMVTWYVLRSKARVVFGDRYSFSHGIGSVPWLFGMKPAVE